MATSDELTIVVRVQDEATAQLQTLNQNMGQFATTTTSTAGAVKSYTATSQEATTATKAATTATKAAGSAQRRAAAATAVTTQTWKRLIAAIAGASAIYAVVRATREAISASIDFDKQLHNVWTLVDETWNEMKRLGEQVRQLAMDFADSSAEATRALYQIYSATFYGAEAMNILEQSMRGAAAGLSDTFTVADMLTTTLNAYRMSADQTEHINDLLFTTIRFGKTTMHELAQQFGRLAGVAAPAGARLEEMTAAIATLTRQGIETDWAITSLRQTMMQILRPGKELESVLSNLGFASGRAALEQLGFSETLRKINAFAKDNGLLLEQLFSNVRAVTAVLPLATTAAGEFAKDLYRMGEAVGASAAAFKKQTESFAFQLGVLREKFRDAGISIGKIFVPALIAILEPIEKVMHAIAWVVEKLGVFGSMVFSSVGTVAVLAAGIWLLKKAFFALNWQLVVLSRNPMSLAFAAAGVALLVLIKGIGKLVSGLRSTKEQMEDLEKFRFTVGGGLAESTQSIISSITSQLNRLQDMRESGLGLGPMAAPIVFGPAGFVNPQGEFSTSIASDMEFLKQNVVETIGRLPNLVSNELKGYEGNVLEATREIVRQIISGIKEDWIRAEVARVFKMSGEELGIAITHGIDPELQRLNDRFSEGDRIASEFNLQFEHLWDTLESGQLSITDSIATWKSMEDMVSQAGEFLELAAQQGWAFVEPLRKMVEYWKEVASMGDPFEGMSGKEFGREIDLALLASNYDRFNEVVVAARDRIAEMEKAIESYNWLGMTDAAAAAQAELDAFKEALGVASDAALAWKDTMASMVDQIKGAIKNILGDLFRGLFKLDDEMEGLSSGNIPRGFKALRAAWGVATPGQPWEDKAADQGTSLQDRLIDLLGGLWDTLVAFVLDHLAEIFAFLAPLVAGFVALVGPVAAVAAFLVALGVAIGVLEGWLAILRGVIQGMADNIRAFVTPIWKEMKEYWERLKPVTEAVRRAISAMSPVFRVLGEIVAFVIQAISSKFEWLGRVIEFIAPILETVFKGIAWIWDNTLKPVLNAMARVMRFVVNIFIGLYNAIAGIVNFLIPFGDPLPKVDLLPALQTNPGEYWKVGKDQIAMVHAGEIVGRPNMTATYNLHLTLPNVSNGQQFMDELDRLVGERNLRQSGNRVGAYGVA